MEVKSKQYRDEGGNDEKHNAGCDPSSKDFSVSPLGSGVFVSKARLEIGFGWDD